MLQEEFASKLGQGLGMGSLIQNSNADSGNEEQQFSTENQIENYLSGLEAQIGQTNEENIALLEENKTLKKQLLEISQFLTENKKVSEEKDQKIRENLTILVSNNDTLKKENIQLR